jgi:hypothetical protein
VKLTILLQYGTFTHLRISDLELIFAREQRGTAKEQAALSLFFYPRDHPHPRISAGHEESQAVNLPVKQRKQ